MTEIVEMTRRRGRPALPPEQLKRNDKAAVAVWRAKAKAKTKNLTIDADLVALLNAHSDKLESTMGFRPTTSQTLRHLLKKA